MKTAVEWYNAKLNAIDFKLNSGLINYEQCKVEMSEAFEQAKEMEKNQLIDFARFRDEYFDKANTMEEFTISDEELIEKFKQNL